MKLIQIWIVHQISREQEKKLSPFIKNLKFTVKRYRPIEEAIITSGGVKVNEINSSTMNQIREFILLEK
ncbi:hypothetical protein BM531_21700 [Clostridioides difficile]|nr:hypothetical protein BM531_21700 [Clostridioides difficile]